MAALNPCKNPIKSFGVFSDALYHRFWVIYGQGDKRTRAMRDELAGWVLGLSLKDVFQDVVHSRTGGDKELRLGNIEHEVERIIGCGVHAGGIWR